MARVVVYTPDLLFGSRVQGALRAAGHEVELVAEEPGVRDAAADMKALVVDLTAEPARGVVMVEALAAEGRLEGIRTLAFYSHVDTDTRELAEAAGFDLVVPRSRMAREGGALVSGLLGA